MKVLIVDDEPLARSELHYLIAKNERIKNIYEAETITEALERMLQFQIDVLFLDIHLMDESGIDLAEKLKKFNNPPAIVFATAYDEYAVKAFELNATDYILKPFDNERVQAAIEKVAQKRPPITKPETIVVPCDERIYLLKPESIVAISVDNNKTTLYTGNESYLTQETLTHWQQNLSDDQFMKVHRSFLINIDEIKEIQSWFNHTNQLTMTNQVKVPVSRSYLKQFRKRVGISPE